MNKAKLIVWPIAVSLITIIGVWRYTVVGATQMRLPTTPAAITAQIEWDGTPVQVTTDSHKKEGSIVRVSPDGENILIAYNVLRDGVDKFDTYYAKSTDQGASWITSTIHVEAGAGPSSLQVDLDYDAAGIAHAVWVFDNDIVYAREGEWALNSFNALYVTGSSSPSLFPNITTSGDEIVDVIWSTTSPNELRHVRSTNGGDSWGLIDKISDSSFKPSPAIIEHNGMLHVVWEDVNATNLVSGTISYSQADPSVLPVTWSEPIEISGNTFPNIHDAREAAIVVNGNQLQVSYTHWQSKTAQSLYLTTCALASDCTQAENWHLRTTPISGAVLGVNADAPWSMFSNLISYNGCTYAHFHGTTAAYAEDNELIWSSNSCNNWTGRRELTNPQVQALFPDATVRGQRVYMTYGQNPTIGDPVQQIFFKRSTAALRKVYLPVILR